MKQSILFTKTKKETIKEDSVEIKKRNKEESNLVKIEKFISYVK